MKKLFLLGFFLQSFSVLGVQLPTGLGIRDIEEIRDTFGGANLMQSMRSAESYETWTGIRLGLQMLFVPTDSLRRLGNKDGSMPGITPIPRISLTKGLPLNMEVNLNFFPFESINAVNTYGGQLKWNFLHEVDSYFAGAMYVGYSWFSAFEKSYSGQGVEFGVVASKDYVRLKPYAGLGMVVSKGEVEISLASGSTSTIWALGSHAYVGVEIETPLVLAAQISLRNLYLHGAIMVGGRF